MELFAVKRYTEELDTAPTTANEAEILETLLKKAKKRKYQQDILANKHEQQQPKQPEEPEITQQSALPTETHKQNKETVGQDIAHVEEETVTTEQEFAVLGEDVSVIGKKQKPVAAVLPAWLAHPTLVSTSIPTDDDGAASKISELSYLAPHIRHALKALKVTRLFPVQAAVVPWLLDAHYKPFPFRPRDICVSAPTGSGKTLAFAIPVVQLLAKRVVPKIRALIVLPVADLALQVFKVLKKLCEFTDLQVCLLSKQFAFTLEQQSLVHLQDGVYHSKVDILVTTPGRLVEHLHATKGFCLQSLKFLIIDEADRIMDAVFQNWLYHLDTHVRHTTDKLLSGRSAPLCFNELLHSAHVEPHKLLFSATLSQDPEKLQKLRLFHPKLFTSSSVAEVQQQQRRDNDGLAQTQPDQRGEFIGKYTTPAELTEKYCITEARLKPLTLYSLIKDQGWKRFLCFTNSINASSRLCFVLKYLMRNSMNVCALPATSQVKERAENLNLFMRGKVNGLICSDALARGIDIPDVDIVISYDAPRHIKTYIHRVGRTARAGRPGVAITLLSPLELEKFNKTLVEAGKTVGEEITVSTTFEEEHASVYANALFALRRNVEGERRMKLLLKKRTIKRTLPIRDEAELTFAEKLQLQAKQRALELTKENMKSSIKRK